MGDRENAAVDLFSKSYNCAQSVFAAFCGEFGLDAETALKIASGFGGGMRCGEACGAATGAVMAIGLKCGLYKEGDLEQKRYCNNKTYEFLHKFKEENGSIICRELLGADVRTTEDFARPELRDLFKTFCPKMVASAVRILEGMEFD